MNVRGVRVAASCVAVLDLVVFGLGCLDSRFSSSDALWVVAEYSEPWRSLALVAALYALYAPFRRAEKSGFRGQLLAGAALSFALASELGKGVYFHPITGAVEVRHALVPLRKIQLRATSEGVCVQPDLSSTWVWYLNRHALWHLPLPKESERFERQMLGASRGQNLSQPDACLER